jgi:hypothetical protein
MNVKAKTRLLSDLRYGHPASVDSETLQVRNTMSCSLPHSCAQIEDVFTPIRQYGASATRLFCKTASLNSARSPVPHVAVSAAVCRVFYWQVDAGELRPLQSTI